MSIIPNINPNLVVLNCRDESVEEIPIVGWIIDDQEAAEQVEENGVPIALPVCVSDIEQQWAVYDRTTDRAYRPFFKTWKSREEAIRELTIGVSCYPT